MEETWKVFPLDERFTISDAGRVRGPRSMLKLQHDKVGYPYFIAWFGGRADRHCKLHKVHRAVLQTFTGEIPQGMHVNHMNGIKSDNRLENLEIVTPSENTTHGFRVLGRKMHTANRARGERHHNSVLTSEQVLEIRRLCAEGVPQKKVAADFNTPASNISAIVRRVAWAHV